MQSFKRKRKEREREREKKSKYELKKGDGHHKTYSFDPATLKNDVTPMMCLSRSTARSQVERREPVQSGRIKVSRTTGHPGHCGRVRKRLKRMKLERAREKKKKRWDLPTARMAFHNRHNTWRLEPRQSSNPSNDDPSKTEKRDKKKASHVGRHLFSFGDSQ